MLDSVKLEDPLRLEHQEHNNLALVKLEEYQERSLVSLQVVEDLERRLGSVKLLSRISSSY